MGVGQVFIYIISGLTFALIMIFGYKAINSFLISGEQVEFIDFKNQLESSVKKIYSEYGAVREETFNLPSSYERICFVNMDYYIENINDREREINQLCQDSSAACDVWKDAQIAMETQMGSGRKDGWNNATANVFLVPTAPNPIKVFRINISAPITTAEGIEYQEKGFHCFDIDEGSFSLVLEGRGDRTEISPPESYSEP